MSSLSFSHIRISISHSELACLINLSRFTPETANKNGRSKRMAEHAACSREPSHQPEDVTQKDGMCQARSFCLTNATPSDEGQLSSLTPSSVDTTNSLSSGETVWKSDNTPLSGPAVMRSTNQDPVDLTNFPMEAKGYHDEDDVLKTTQPVWAEPLTEKDEKIKLIPAHGPRQLRTRLHRFKQTSTPILLCLLAIRLLATVITYVQATYAAEERSNRGRPLSELLKTDIGRTLTILRTSQGILSASVSLALQNAFVLLQWGQMHPPDGISYLNVLALSPTTGALGTFGLIKSSAPKISAKIWALLR